MLTPPTNQRQPPKGEQAQHPRLGDAARVDNDLIDNERTATVRRPDVEADLQPTSVENGDHVLASGIVASRGRIAGVLDERAATPEP